MNFSGLTFAGVFQRGYTHHEQSVRANTTEPRIREVAQIQSCFQKQEKPLQFWEFGKVLFGRFLSAMVPFRGYDLDFEACGFVDGCDEREVGRFVDFRLIKVFVFR